MIVKRNFNPVRVIGYVRAEIIVATGVASLVFALNRYDWHGPVIPFSVAAILGSALAIFIAFRNNSSYSRWWEARTLWGGIVNSSRVLARLIITFTDSHAHQPGYHAGRSAAFKRELVYLNIAWAHSMRIHLRREDSWNQLEGLMKPEDYQGLLKALHKPNYLHMLTGRRIYQAMADGTLGGFDSFQMEGQMLALANYQGGCERIKNTPMLRQYDYFTRVFLFTFIIMLPWSLIGDFARLNADYLVIPVSMIISFVFSIIGKVGEVNENPFENRITDVPLTAICNTIERDLREMLGETDLPERSVPHDGFLF